MPETMKRHGKFFLLAFLGLFFFGARPEEFARDNVFFQGFLIQKPVIRIALGVNVEDVEIHAASGMKVYQVSGSYKLMAEDISEVRVKGQKDKLSEKFTVQAAQSRKREDAEDEAKALKAKIGKRVYVAQDAKDDLVGVYQVRVGDFLTRTDALDCIKELTKLGYKEAWIIRDEVTEPTTKPRWVLLNGELINLSAETALYFIPSTPQSYLAYGGRSYRGIFVLRGSRRGILLINILNIEDYLRGVVPGELSPYIYPELEAQKAQAVAARTYALKNTGQFEEFGFDLYATPTSQVYEGLSIEHPLSSQAVDETRGEVAVYAGKLINALYMSTCGGMTEDAEAMFEGNPVPYLKATECVYENEEEWQVRASAVLPAVMFSGVNASPKLALLMALDVIPYTADAAAFGETAAPAETAESVRKAAALLGKKGEKIGTPPPVMSHAAFARLVVDGFEWQDRVQNLLGKSEADRITRDMTGLKAEEKGALTYFLVTGIYPDTKEIGDKSRPLTRAEAGFYLAKVLATYKDFTHQGYIKSVAKDKIEVIEDKEKKSIDLAPNLFAILGQEDSLTFVPTLDLSGGDVVKWVESAGRIRLLQAIVPSLGNILDQASPFHRWQVRISREDLESRINQYYPVGPLVDVVPLKRGKSKRVVDAAIIGRESQVHVTGLKIRQVLNLRDNLFVVDREVDADGHPTHFVFSGKGWGHGVGLCQIGAFRMAQEGAAYADILKKYYKGIKLEKMY
jgi:stage II sporulation protein D